MRVSVVLVAGGAGRRMNAGRPKAFLPLAGKPLYRHSLETFGKLREITEVVVVVPKGSKVQIPGAQVVEGGARRQDSVFNGLEATDPRSSVVLIHDAARPFVTVDVIRRVIKAAARKGAAIAAVPSRDTLKRVSTSLNIVETPDRSRHWCAQTPQGFRREILLKAYRSGHGKRDATDDMELVERAGGRGVVVPGETSNFKITSSDDLRYAEYILTM